VASDIAECCPACGSTEIVQDLDGKWRCLDCGYKWDEEIHKEDLDGEVDVDGNYREEDDQEDAWTEEEEEEWFGEE